jgi:hypothetical protein
LNGTAVGAGVGIALLLLFFAIGVVFSQRKQGGAGRGVVRTSSIHDVIMNMSNPVYKGPASPNVNTPKYTFSNFLPSNTTVVYAGGRQPLNTVYAVPIQGKKGNAALCTVNNGDYSGYDLAAPLQVGNAGDGGRQPLHAVYAVPIQGDDGSAALCTVNNGDYSGYDLAAPLQVGNAGDGEQEWQGTVDAAQTESAAICHVKNRSCDYNSGYYIADDVGGGESGQPQGYEPIEVASGEIYSPMVSSAAGGSGEEPVTQESET